jgi:hypothetical protein
VFADLDTGIHDLGTGITVAFLSTGMRSCAQGWTQKGRLVRAVLADIGLDDDILAGHTRSRSANVLSSAIRSSSAR